MPTWLSIDTDDLRHLPVHQGHPTRSRVPFAGAMSELSSTFVEGWEGFVQWMGRHDGAVTLFVISDMLDIEGFRLRLGEALQAFSGRLTVGCHGHTHRSWSAWGEDGEGFSSMLSTSTAALKKAAGDAFLPVFRAPNGYIAPWMAPVLAAHGYRIDSSVNPSLLVRRKAGGARWSDVTAAMREANVTERAWLTRFGLPVNGPALFRFPLSLLARRAWAKAPPLLTSMAEPSLADVDMELTTLYCHVLDFARQDGTWTPPLTGRTIKGDGPT